MHEDDTEWWVRDPDPGRPVVSATEVHRILGHDLATVQRLIRTNESKGGLAGGKYPGKARWWVYVDADPRIQAAVDKQRRHPRRSDEPPLASSGENALRRQLAASEAKLRDREEALRQLTTAAALETERADLAHKANESLLKAHEHLLKAFTESRSEAVMSLQISNIYRDLLASNYIPNDPGELTQH